RDLALVGLEVGLDEDGDLDQAGGGHDGVGVVKEGLAGGEVLDADGHLALVRLDQRRETSFQAHRLLGSEGEQTESEGKGHGLGLLCFESNHQSGGPSSALVNSSGNANRKPGNTLSPSSVPIASTSLTSSPPR